MQIKLKSVAVGLAIAALAPAAALADTASHADKANAARACKALQSSMGAATFAQTYQTFGKCASAWTRAEHQNRHEAETACKAENRDAKRGILQKCIQAKQQAARVAERSATVRAAKACKAERTSMGAAEFTAKYGGKAANAFGKCVSKLAQAQNDA
jgi:hypothetical protein